MTLHPLRMLTSAPPVKRAASSPNSARCPTPTYLASTSRYICAALDPTPSSVLHILSSRSDGDENTSMASTGQSTSQQEQIHERTQRRDPHAKEYASPQYAIDPRTETTPGKATSRHEFSGARLTPPGQTRERPPALTSTWM